MSRPTENQKYAAEWSKFKKWRFFYFGGIFGIGPMLVGLSLLSTALEPNQPDIPNRYPIVGLFIFALFVGSSLIASFKYLNFKCPRCDKVFGDIKWPVTFNRCSYCGLPVGAENE